MKSQNTHAVDGKNPQPGAVDHRGSAEPTQASARHARPLFEDLHVRITTRAYELYVQRGMMLHPPGLAWLHISGAVTLFLGLLMWAEWPASGLWVIGTFVAIDMVFSGTWLIMLALNARSLPPSGTHRRPIVQPSATFDAQPSPP